MGFRSTVQVVESEHDFSPLAYCHWHGSRVLDTIKRAAPAMRAGDLHYATARLFGHLHNDTGGDGEIMSFGISNIDRVVREDLSGDAGHYLLNLRDGTVTNYTHDNPDGSVVIENLEFGRL